LYSASLVWPMMTSSMSRLRELLRLDLVLLRGAEKIVEERDVELEDLDELRRCRRLAMLNSPSKLNARGSEFGSRIRRSCGS